MKTLTLLIAVSLFSGLVHASNPAFIKTDVTGTLSADVEMNNGSVTIEGQAAHKLYDLLSIEARELKDPDDGVIHGYRKMGQNYTCSKYASGKYDCVFAITDLENGNIWSK